MYRYKQKFQVRWPTHCNLVFQLVRDEQCNPTTMSVPITSDTKLCIYRDGDLRLTNVIT